MSDDGSGDYTKINLEINITRPKFKLQNEILQWAASVYIILFVNYIAKIWRNN